MMSGYDVLKSPLVLRRWQKVESDSDAIISSAGVSQTNMYAQWRI